MDKIFLNQNQRGSILILAMLILSVMIFSATYVLSFTLTGSKITGSYELSTKAYYLAEAGLSEAIFKLKNDPAWKNAFETLPTEDNPTCSGWSIAPFTRSSALESNNSYEITVANLGCAKAEITATAKINTGGDIVAQKVVKTKVFKAMGSPVSEYGVFTGGSSENLDIRSTVLRVHNGNLFSNSNIQVKSSSDIDVDEDIFAGGNIIIDDSSSSTASTTCSSNICQAGCDPATECPPASVSMPRMEIDSTSSNSYLSLAKASDCSLVRSDGKTDCFFTLAEFEKVMWQNYPVLSFPTSTVYVSGDVNVRAGQDLRILGVLAAERDVNLGVENCWSYSLFPFLRCGFSRLTVSRPGTTTDNMASGVLAKRKFNTGSWFGFGLSALDVNGLVYSGDEMKFSSVVAPMVIRGAIAARKVSLSSLWLGLDIYLDSDVIIDTFKDPEYSPVINIDHWEEKY